MSVDKKGFRYPKKSQKEVNLDAEIAPDVTVGDVRERLKEREKPFKKGDKVRLKMPQTTHDYDPDTDTIYPKENFNPNAPDDVIEGEYDEQDGFIGVRNDKENMYVDPWATHLLEHAEEDDYPYDDRPIEDIKGFRYPKKSMEDEQKRQYEELEQEWENNYDPTMYGVEDPFIDNLIITDDFGLQVSDLEANHAKAGLRRARNRMYPKKALGTKSSNNKPQDRISKREVEIRLVKVKEGKHVYEVKVEGQNIGRFPSYREARAAARKRLHVERLPPTQHAEIGYSPEEVREMQKRQTDSLKSGKKSLGEKGSKNRKRKNDEFQIGDKVRLTFSSHEDPNRPNFNHKYEVIQDPDFDQYDVLRSTENPEALTVIDDWDYVEKIEEGDHPYDDRPEHEIKSLKRKKIDKELVDDIVEYNKDWDQGLYDDPKGDEIFNRYNNLNEVDRSELADTIESLRERNYPQGSNQKSERTDSWAKEYSNHLRNIDSKGFRYPRKRYDVEQQQAILHGKADPNQMPTRMTLGEYELDDARTDQAYAVSARPGSWFVDDNTEWNAHPMGEHPHQVMGPGYGSVQSPNDETPPSGIQLPARYIDSKGFRYPKKAFNPNLANEVANDRHNVREVLRKYRDQYPNENISEVSNRAHLSNEMIPLRQRLAQVRDNHTEEDISDTYREYNQQPDSFMIYDAPFEKEEDE